MTQDQILDIFKKTGAILEGHFKLSSGLHSAQYLQCAKVLQYPEYAEKLCKELAKKLRHCEGAIAPEAISAVVAPALGGIVVSHEVARALGVKSLFTERVEGKMTLRRGFELKKGDKVLVVEDVVTTGLSTKEVIETVTSLGSTVVGVGCIIDRSKEEIDFGAPFKSLIKIDIPTYSPESCPLCAKNISITKPGSRSDTNKVEP